MPKNIFPLDSAKSFTEQELLGHNRWHPEIPPVATLKATRSRSRACSCRLRGRSFPIRGASG